METTTSPLGAALRATRLRHGKTVPEVADAIDRAPQTVYRWEWGDSYPHHTDLEKLAAVYGITVGQLVDGSAEEQPNNGAGS